MFMPQEKEMEKPIPQGAAGLTSPPLLSLPATSTSDVSWSTGHHHTTDAYYNLLYRQRASCRAHATLFVRQLPRVQRQQGARRQGLWHTT